MAKALLVVDVQNDFYEEGALPVPEASKINTKINYLLESDDYKVILASQDWHPANHKSFAVNMGEEPYTPYNNDEGIGPVLWPVHCQQGSTGAGFHEDIRDEFFDYIIRKGTNPLVDSYSAFRENNGTELGVAGLLRDSKIDEIDVCGLALDYCVKFTALDAIKSGFKTNLILSATRGVEANPGDVERVIDELEEAGVKLKD